MAIEYRLCTTSAEFEAVQALEMHIWRMPNGNEAISSHTMHILAHTGGMVMAAYDGATMIGMAVAFATRTQGLLWSHMAGVHPDYQGQGIGYEIKQAQREWAIANGYTEMRWSFDPAMRRNAHFNFHLLGAKTNIYHRNFYGLMKDGINAGVPSDRFEAIWQFDAQAHSHADIPDKIAFLLDIDNQQAIIAAKPTEAYHAVLCPYDFPAIKAQSLDLAIQWRHTMGDVLQAAFDMGYFVVDFVSKHDEQQCYYVLQRA